LQTPTFNPLRYRGRNQILSFCPAVLNGIFPGLPVSPNFWSAFLNNHYHPYGPALRSFYKVSSVAYSSSLAPSSHFHYLFQLTPCPSCLHTQLVKLQFCFEYLSIKYTNDGSIIYSFSIETLTKIWCINSAIAHYSLNHLHHLSSPVLRSHIFKFPLQKWELIFSFLFLLSRWWISEHEVM